MAACVRCILPDDLARGPLGKGDTDRKDLVAWDRPASALDAFPGPVRWDDRLKIRARTQLANAPVTELPGWLTEDLVRNYRIQRQGNGVRRGGAPNPAILVDAVFSMSATQASSAFRHSLPAQNTGQRTLHRPLVES